jgi:hypothetical protein
MVRQVSQRHGLYTTKMRKATETSSGFSSWDGSLPVKVRKSAMINPYDNRNEH